MKPVAKATATGMDNATMNATVTSALKSGRRAGIQDSGRGNRAIRTSS